MSRPAALLATGLALFTMGLVSPSAFAQGPGDDQYVDPFGKVPEEPTQQPPEPEPDPPSSPPSDGGDSTTSSAPDTAADTGNAVPDATTSDGTATAGTGEELARTGLPAGLLAVLGTELLLAGLIMKLVVAPRARGS